jgi:hypothetical protein
MWCVPFGGLIFAFVNVSIQLTVIPSLDTLDISHNRLKRLPSQPGSLINLRVRNLFSPYIQQCNKQFHQVFCFSRNKVTRLPSYLSKFHRLNILKVDRNPIEWPPKFVMDASGSLDTAQAMKDWIRTIQRWMDDDPSRTKFHDDSGFSEQHELENNMYLPSTQCLSLN